MVHPDLQADPLLEQPVLQGEHLPLLGRFTVVVAEQVQRAEGMATRDCWDRLYKVVSKAAEKLADPKGIFRDSLVENARELCELLPRLNVMDDPNLEAMRHSVEKALCVHDADDLRKSSIMRNETAAKLASIMDTMGAFYAPSTP